MEASSKRDGAAQGRKPWWKFWGPRTSTPRPTRHVVLRNTRDADGTRYLQATLSPQGEVVIEGRDYGDGVERVLGDREYEWAWTIPQDQLPALRTALGEPDDLLLALQERCSGDRAGDVGPFLETHGIQARWWSRQGD
jgi:hypothetical protein